MPYGDYPSTSQDPGVYGTYLADAGTGTGGFFAKQRYYNSNWARFMTVDPLGSSARVASPQSWNRYGYALGDPVNANDPSGLDVVCGAIPSGGEGVRSDSMPCYGTDPGVNGVAVDGQGAVGQVQVEGTNMTVASTPLGPDTTRMFLGVDTASQGQTYGPPSAFGGGGLLASSSGPRKERPAWLNSITSLFGYDQQSALPSCFVVQLKTTVNDLNPFSPSVFDFSQGALQAGSAIKYNQALGYAARIGLTYPFKSSVFRNLIKVSGTLGAVADSAPLFNLIYGLMDGLNTEIDAMQSGKCQ